MNALQSQLRSATPEDATTIAALAIQIFLDTYATDGVRPDLAREAFTEYSTEAFANRLQESRRQFFLAEQGTAIIGFSEILLANLPAPVAKMAGAELVRLYIQPRYQRRGVGRDLIQLAEQAAASKGLGAVWLTAWEGNAQAHRFYAALGYEDIGTATYSFEGNSYNNRVFTKHLLHGEV